MLQSRIIIIIILLTFCVLSCKRGEKRYQSEKPTPTPELTVDRRINNVKRKGNQVTFDYSSEASKEDLATESSVIADCKTFHYQTTYWAITKKGIPIMENDKTTPKKVAEGDMKEAIKTACS